MYSTCGLFRTFKMSFHGTVSLIFLLSLSYTVDADTEPSEETHPIYDDCVEAHQKDCQGGNSTDRRYLIKSRTTVGFEETECHSAGGEYIRSGCTGSGWTLIGVLKGDNSTNDTSYDSAIWTAKGDDQTNFNSQFWSANVTEVCLTSDAFSIQFPVQAPSLRSLFFQKNTLDMSSDQWLSSLADGISGPFFETITACYETGFNVGDPNYVQARIGIVSLDNAGAGCPLAGPQAIGVGIKVAGQDYGSVHGVVSDDIDEAYHDVSVYVRSQPDPSEPEAPTPAAPTSATPTSATPTLVMV